MLFWGYCSIESLGQVAAAERAVQCWLAGGGFFVCLFFLFLLLLLFFVVWGFFKWLEKHALSSFTKYWRKGGFSLKKGARLQLKTDKLKLHGLKECNVWITGKWWWDSCCLEPLPVDLLYLHIRRKDFGHPWSKLI